MDSEMKQEGDGGKEVRSTDIGDLAKEIKTLLAKDFSSAEKSSEIVAILKSGLVKCGKGQCAANLSTYAVYFKLCFDDFTHSQFSNFYQKMPFVFRLYFKFNVKWNIP